MHFFKSSLIVSFVSFVLIPLSTKAIPFDPVRLSVTYPGPGTFTRQFIANRDTKILVDGECIGVKTTAKVDIQWTLAVFDDCSAKDANGSCKELATKISKDNESEAAVPSSENYQFFKSQIQTVTCGNAKDFYTRWTPFYLYSAVGFDPIDSETCVNSTLPNNNNTNEIIAETWRPGIYRLSIAVKNSKDLVDDSNFKLHLSIEVKNSRGGYLPAPNQPLLPFWAAMMLVTSVMVIAWSVICGKDWRGVVKIHLAISITIFTAFLEAAFGLTVAHGANRYGQPYVVWHVANELAQAAKSATVRVLLIIIAMGYGTVKANRFRRSIYAPICFFGIYVYVGQSVPTIISVFTPMYSKLVFYSRLLTFVANVITGTWVTVSMMKTIQILKQHGDHNKLKLYYIFSAILGVCSVLGLVFAGFRYYFLVGSGSRLCSHWDLWWLDEAFWPLMSLAVITSIFILWRPSQTAITWAYSSLLTNAEPDWDDEAFSMASQPMQQFDRHF